MAKTSLFDIAIWAGVAYVGYKYVLPRLGSLGMGPAAPQPSLPAPVPAGSTLPRFGIAPSGTGWVVMWNGQPIRYTENRVEAGNVYDDAVSAHGGVLFT